MKKSITKTIIFLFTLMIISTSIILIFGRTHNVVFIHNSDNSEITIENKDEAIEVVDKKKKDDKYIVKIRALKEGEAYISIKHNDFKESKKVYVHKSKIITENNFFGKSTYSEVIPISLTIMLLYLLYSLIKKYNYNKKDNLYQYKNIAYLGIIIFISFLALSNFMSIFNYQGLYETINKINSSMSFVSVFLFPIALITFLLVTISNIRLIIKEGISIRNILGLSLGIFICLATLLPDFAYSLLMKAQIVDIYNLNSPGPYIYNFIESLIYLTIAYLECILIGTIIIALKSVKRKIAYNKDYMIVLGCQIKKDGSLTPLLKGRVDKALEFRNKQLELTGKDLVFIPSGGKGNDEIIPESIAMKNYLLSQGIKEKNILVEDKSKNTFENIKYSYKLIKNKESNIAFSTTNYHVLRAGLIATEQGIKMEGIGSNTKAYFWINAFIREFIGTLYSERKKHIIIFILIIIVIIMMIGISYLANNI